MNGMLAGSGFDTGIVTFVEVEFDITPTAREFSQKGGGAAIATSGDGDWIWSASASDDWISLNATTGAVGKSVFYMVAANTDAEDRVGYVYVSKVSRQIHTIRQKGLGAAVDTTAVTVERDGGTGTVTVSPTNADTSWKAHSNCDWISVSPTNGTGSAKVTYQVDPWYEVSTRSGTITVGGNSITVFQYGSRVALDANATTNDYNARVISVKIAEALEHDTWSVTPNADWISVVDAGSGQAGDTVSIAVSENPSYKARTGTVTIGTETFTVTQEGRTALSFAVSPVQTTAAVDGGSGCIEVAATPDLPWAATCEADWIAIQSSSQAGAGDGTVAYTVSPQSTLLERTATITVTPEAASGMSPQTHKVVQPAASSTLSRTDCEISASGGTVSVDVTVGDVVKWSVDNLPDWVSLSGSASRVGSGTVTLSATANTAAKREATIRIAEKDFRIVQGVAYRVEVTCDVTSFDRDGGMGTITIRTDGEWTAVVSDLEWIVIWGDASGVGDGSVTYIVAPFEGASRTGTITIGNAVILITQKSQTADVVGITAEVVGGGKVSGAGSYVRGGTVTLTAVPDAGYEFLRWTGDAGETVQNPLTFTATEAKSVTAHFGLLVSGRTQSTYCVIDLSGGVSAASYPVTYLDAEPSGGFNATEYKTTKLVLKRVEAGSFIMGEDQSDESHRVTLTKAFYMGLFEVTQKQWELVMGSNPSRFSGDAKPVERVSYDDIRGASEGSQWPATDAVDDSSFLGKLRAKTGLDVDLPTEAQWECVCRAGTTTIYSYGDSANGDYMWYSGNTSQTQEVGTKKPNPWGFYDMHGNVWEWCLDWYGALSYGADPVGPDSASKRVQRGDSWYSNYELSYESYWRFGQYDDHGGGSAGDFGFRLVSRTLPPTASTPTVEGDDGVTVAGDAEAGFVVKPSKTDAVVVTIPSGVDAAKVTVKVSPETKKITLNGAAVRVMRGEADITGFLDIPAAVGGVIDLGAATVKEEYVKEPLNAEKGAKVDFSSPSKPSLTTAPTQKGLVYRLKEGATLEEMAADTTGVTKVGDGNAWTPTLSVTGGTSGFYTIEVEK